MEGGVSGIQTASAHTLESTPSEIPTATGCLRMLDQQIVDVEVQLDTQLTEAFGVQQPLFAPIGAAHNAEAIFQTGILSAAVVTFEVGHTIFWACQLKNTFFLKFIP